MIFRTDTGLSFDDVLLVPHRGHVMHRSEADISSELVRGVRLAIPIVSAPMDSVTGGSLAAAMRVAGGFGIVHRFQSINDQVLSFDKSRFGALKKEGDQVKTDPYCAGVALGINESYERWKTLYNAGARIFCLDVAHGHHDSVAEFLENAPDDIWKTEDVKMIAGNVATGEGAVFLADLGVDAIKVGIGPGAACITRQVTGFGVPQLTAIMEVREALGEDADARIIADGGIKTSGDIVKALAAGADTVMVGRLLAGADESPYPGKYWGMASKRVNNHRAPEGAEGDVPLTGPVEDTLKELAWGIRSGVSYGGARNIEELRRYAEFMRVTPMTQVESGARV